MPESRVCLQRPLPEGGYEFVCERVFDLETVPKAEAGPLAVVYRTKVPVSLGVAVGWRIVNYGRVYRVSSVSPDWTATLSRPESSTSG